MAKKLTRRQRQNQTLYNPMAMLTGNQLRGTVRDLVNLELRPQLGALKREGREATRTNNALAERTNDYFARLAPLQQQASQAQASASTALAQRLAGISQNAQSTIDQAAAQAQQRGVDDTALRGQGLDAGMAQRLAAEIAAQKGMAAGQNAALSEQATSRAGAFEGLANLAGSVSAMRGQEVQGVLANQLAGQLRDIQGRRSDLRASRGPLQSRVLTDLRGQLFEQEMAREAFGLQRRTARHERKMDRKELRLARDTLQVNNTQAMAGLEADLIQHGNTVNQWGYTNNEWRSLPVKERLRVVKDLQNRGQGPDMGKINEYGFSEREWRGMSSKRRRQIINQHGADGGEKAKMRREARVEGQKLLQQAGALAQAVGPAFGTEDDDLGRKVNGGDIRRLLARRLKDADLVEVAMDLIFNYGGGRLGQGKLRSSTLNRLKKRGIPRGAIPRAWL